MYVQVQGQGGWSTPYPTCNQVNLLCSSVTLEIKQPVPLLANLHVVFVSVWIGQYSELPTTSSP